MYALNEQHLVVCQFFLLARHLSLARLEIIARQLHLLAIDEGVQVIVEQFEVQGIERFVVVFAILVLGCLVAVKEIIIQRYVKRLYPVYEKLYGQTLACGGLTTA